MLGSSVFRARHTFPGTTHVHHRERLTELASEFNTRHLSVIYGIPGNGAGRPDLSAGPAAKASMGLGPGPVWALGQCSVQLKKGPGLVWVYDLGTVQ